jgi:hypothetical protein
MHGRIILKRVRYLRLMCWVIPVAAALSLAEIIGYSDRTFRESQLDFLRRRRTDGSNDFWDLVPEMFDSVIIGFCTSENREVVAARYERQPEQTNRP